MSDRKIHDIKIEKLGVDVCNIRQGSWNYDQELINSVKTAGIKQALLVRPIKSQPEGKEYGIVCGSRRYHAALAADLEEVPCQIEEMDDLEALSTSMIENRQRSDTPTWLDIESVGRIYNALQDISHEEKIEYIINSTGMSHSTIERYLNIFFLPEEVKGLLRNPDERTTQQSETLLLYQARASDKTLSIGNAACLSEIKNLEKGKLMETAVFIMDKSNEAAEKLVKYVKIYPDKPINEIYDEIIEKVYGKYEKSIRFDKETWDAITRACMARQMIYDRYLIKIINDRLEKDGYLGVQKAIELEMAEEEKEYVAVKASKGSLEKCGYTHLKDDGRTKIYQRPTKNGSGGFFKAFNKGHTTYIKLTPGNYDDPWGLLKNEKKMLLGYK